MLTYKTFVGLSMNRDTGKTVFGSQQANRAFKEQRMRIWMHMVFNDGCGGNNRHEFMRWQKVDYFVLKEGQKKRSQSMRKSKSTVREPKVVSKLRK